MRARRAGPLMGAAGSAARRRSAFASHSRRPLRPLSAVSDGRSSKCRRVPSSAVECAGSAVETLSAVARSLRDDREQRAARLFKGAGGGAGR